MVIGPVAAGKTSLLAALGLGPNDVSKTQALTYYAGQSIDTPGEMLSIPRFYNALILNSSRASAILMVMDGRRAIWLPVKLSLALKAPVIGVVTKTDIADSVSLDRAVHSLTTAGAERIFKVSSVTGQGLDELRACLLQSADGQLRRSLRAAPLEP
jgi:ethanolamine utilization protein EutP